MRINQFYFWSLISLLVFAFIGESHAQSIQQQQAYNQSVSYLRAFNTDSALLVLDNLVRELERRNKVDSPFALRVKLRQAEAFEKDDQNEAAIQALIQLKEVTFDHGPHDVYARASLILARLFEKIERGISCKTNLEDARSAIQKNALDSIYPLFAIREASYQRIYGDRDSALFYANEVLRTAPLFNQLNMEADGHLLMGLMMDDPTHNKNIEYFNKAAEIFWKLKDFNGYSAMMFNIARRYFHKKDIGKALTYNNLALKTARISMDNGAESGFILFEGYKFRGQLYRQIGRHDSAWHYLNKGYALEIDYLEQKNDERVIEIDAKYQNEQKAKKIEAQDAEIKF